MVLRPEREIEQSRPLASDAVQPGDHPKLSDQPQRKLGAVGKQSAYVGPVTPPGQKSALRYDAE